MPLVDNKQLQKFRRVVGNEDIRLIHRTQPLQHRCAAGPQEKLSNWSCESLFDNPAATTALYMWKADLGTLPEF